MSFRVPVVVLCAAVCVASACVSPKRIGGFPISGIVSDKSTGEPLAGAEIRAYFTVSDAYGVNENPLAGVDITDEQGRFEIFAERETVIGGIGGWSGHVNKRPHLVIHKAGYCGIGRGFGIDSDRDPSPGEFLGLRIELTEKHDGCYETFTPERG